MKRRTKTGLTVLAIIAVLAIAGGVVLYRGYRVGSVALDFISNMRYQIASGEDVAETPAGEAMAVGYLETIFGDNQELLGRLKGVVQRGLEDDKALKLGEVSSMVVTYSRDEEGNVDDVVAHVLGAFPRKEDFRKPGFNRDGYFRHLIDRDMWNLGNAVIGLLGRDMIMFAEEDVAQAQQDMITALFERGDVLPLARRIEKTLHYTAVFPDPRRLLPHQLRRHIQAIVVKGKLAPDEGQSEVILLCPSSKSAAYALGILSDMKTVGEVMLRTKWNGVETITPWGAHWVDTWWAYEMVQLSEQAAFKKEHNILRIKTAFGRVMVNAYLKSIERMGRDLAQSRGWQEDKLDPRRVDAGLASAKPQHYWSESHRWGANWPFGSPDLTNEVVQTEVVAQVEPVTEVSATP